jgi:iron complex outermembrane receptor protein
MLKVIGFLITFNILANSGFSAAGGGISGLIYDYQTGDSLSWADIFIDELHRSGSSGKDGHFFIPNIPAGEYTVHISRVGYKESHLHLKIEENENKSINIPLIPQWLESETIVVEDHRDHSHLQKADIEIDSRKLRRNLGTTLAETIKNEPGLDQLSNGPAPARPVLRGLSGDRLLLLEDGERTGDLSNSSADHAVTIEPLNAERIEVVRGPKTLIYGSNTLSGVINVISVQNNPTGSMTGHFNTILESVNSGYTTSGVLEIPLNHVTTILNGSYRSADNLNTPRGILKNTFLTTYSGNGKIIWNPQWGILKTEGGIYRSDYGIPPSPPELGHPAGIDIFMQKNTFNTELTIFKTNEIIKNVSLKYDLKNYFHEEISNNSQDAAFSLSNHYLTLKSNVADIGFSENIIAGIWGEHRLFNAGGRTNTVNTKELTLAAFIYQETSFNDLKTSAALRLENKIITPQEEKYDSRVGQIRERSFTESAFSVKAEYGFSADYFLSLNLIRAFRIPGIEELFSDGPHLASYAYEVGNADLDPETTYGIELSTEYEGRDITFTMAVFYNQINGYLFSQNTGQRSWRRNDLYRYKIVGLDALIKGAELSASWDINAHLNINGSISYLQGDLLENYQYFDPEGLISANDFVPFKYKTDQPLPFMPPFKLDFNTEYKLSSLNFLYGFNLVTRQNRLGKFETSTAGYTLHHIGFEYFVATEHFLQSFYFSVDNIFNTEYRNHLNRIKDIFPEAGRNIKILYKLYF